MLNHNGQLSQLLEKLEKKTVSIFGLGREGLSSYEFLRTHFPTKTITLVDENSVEQLSASWQKIDSDDQYVQFTQNFDSLAEKSNVLVVLSPGILPRSNSLKQAQAISNVEFTSNTNLLFELISSIPRITTIGVTGTKGKSTTTAMIHHVLKYCGLPAFLGGNIGIPPLSLWEEIESELSSSGNEPIVLALELSSHQLSTIQYSPNIAVVLDISPEHLDYYASFDEYVAAKTKIVEFQTEKDTVIFDNTKNLPRKIASMSKAKQVVFDAQNTLEVIDPTELLVVGKHNILNSIPSILIGRFFNFSDEEIATSLKSFKPLPHRLELVAEKDGIKYINDSLSTTPKATIAALQSFDTTPIVLIAGGHNRNLDFTELAEAINASTVKYLILFPDTGYEILAAVEKHKQIPHTVTTSMEKAVAIAKANTKSGDIVLLSPGSASFGCFNDYRDRGNQFRKYSLSSS